MAPLAKLTPPRLGDTYRRERLFARLDAARQGAAVWITGPPGAGKTTLVASYLQARKLAVVWYQVDSGDADPATLFHLLREALPARRRAALPLLIPEYMQDLDGYARRYFRLLFERLARPLLLVFDNLHEVAPSSALPAILLSAVHEAPPEVSLVTVSREAAPPAFARLVANGQLEMLGWDDLRLDAEETAAIVALQGTRDAQRAARLHELSGGWAAGIRLLAGAPADAPRVVAGDQTVPQLLFDYLANEVFDEAPAALQTLWLRTAQLSRFSAAVARELSGDPGADRRLEALWRRRYFIDRSSQAEPVYQYHALFRTFLREQFGRRFGEAVCHRQARDAGRLLERHGDVEGALALYREGEDWSAAAQLIVREAGALLSTGRLRTLDAWIGLLPAETIASDPWLLFWRGCCAAYSGAIAQARRDLAEAFERHAQHSSVLGQGLAASVMLQSYILEWNEFGPVDHWAAVLRELLAAQPGAFAEPALELRVQAALLLALTYRVPQDALAPLCAQRVLQLCRADIGAADRLNGASALVLYMSAEQSLGATAQVIAEFDALAHSSVAAPSQRVLWYWSLALNRFQAADDPAAKAVLRESLELCTTQGLSYIIAFVRLQSLWSTLSEGDCRTAHRELQAIERELPGLRPNDVALYHFVRAWLALLEGEPGLALEHGAVAARMAPALGSIGPLICSCGVHSQALIACGHAEQALVAARVPQPFVRLPGIGSFRFNALLFEADALLNLQRRAEFLEVLRAALATGRGGGFLSMIVLLPAMAARLCAAALEAGIEVEYVQRLIRARALRAPTPHTEHWPWAVRVEALGDFSVRIDGSALEFKGKAQKRPLELLKLLIAHGGQAVGHMAVLERLWPDLDGDAARNALDLTLHRLRKLLVHGDAVLLEDGRLRLDPHRVWVDSWAFEHLCSTIEARVISEPVDRLAQELLRLYQGPLLPGEDAPWIAAARRNLQQQLELAVARLAGMPDAEHSAPLARVRQRQALQRSLQEPE